jgi:hypothetical protein
VFIDDGSWAVIYLSDSANDSVFSAVTNQLAETHWYILRAANVMSAEMYVRREPTDGIHFTTTEATDFGREVGRDEIHWWVFKRESEIDLLRDKTGHALDAVQRLRTASDRLRRQGYPDSYEELLGRLKQFTEANAADIGVLHDYVVWLASRDVRAPVLLFTHRVWGDTRRGDRWAIEPKATEPRSEDLVIMRRLAETVLGLRLSQAIYAFDRAAMDVAEDMYAGESVGEIPIDHVVARASSFAFSACAEYFAQVRDSLRNILIDIDKFTEQTALLHSELFWREFITKAVKSKKTEVAIWDFKETLTMWHVQGAEKERAKATFAEDVAAMANARGGVLIVGVTDKRQFVGIGSAKDVENRLKSAADVIAEHVESERPVVTFHQVGIPDSNGNAITCLVVIVAQSASVVSVRVEKGRYTFPVRRETGITRGSRLDAAGVGRFVKSDNHDFVSELVQFNRENA